MSGQETVINWVRKVDQELGFKRNVAEIVIKLSCENLFDLGPYLDLAVFVKRVREALGHIIKVFDLHLDRILTDVYFALLLKRRFKQRVKRALSY